MTRIDLTDAKLGDRHYLGRQRYTVVGWQPHTRRDGTETTLVQLATCCADCDEPMTVTASQQSNGFSRRCQGRRRRGRVVGWFGFSIDRFSQRYRRRTLSGAVGRQCGHGNRKDRSRDVGRRCC